MEQNLDKTSEIETRLKQISIIPENTCLFFKRDISSASVHNKCEYCTYANFENCGDSSKRTGFCGFKSSSRAIR